MSCLLWAVLRTDVVSGTDTASVARSNGHVVQVRGGGDYTVQFDQDISNGAVVATAEGVIPDSSPRAILVRQRSTSPDGVTEPGWLDVIGAGAHADMPAIVDVVIFVP